MQVQLAPQVQAETEYKHSLEVLGDMEGVQQDTVRAAETGTSGGTVVKVGADYPNYLVLIQPAGPYGTIETTDERQFNISNAQATDPEVRDYVDGSTLSFNTSGLRYSPNYVQFESAPEMVVADTAFLAEYDDQTKVLARPNLVDGRRINLVTTTGEISRTTTEPTLIRTEPLSASRTTVRINETTGSHIKLRIGTTLSLSTWKTMLAGQIDGDTSAASPATDDDGRYVAELEMDTSTDPDTLVIHLESDVTYRLNAARLGYRSASQPQFGLSKIPDAKYLAATSDRDPVVVERKTVELTVQVRDGYHNPKSNVQVEVEQIIGPGPDKGSVEPTSGVSGKDGTVTFEYTAPNITQPTDDVDSREYTVRIEIVGENGPMVRAHFTVQVQNVYD